MCCKCGQWRELRYYKDSNKTDGLCVKCNFCRLKQNTYASTYNRLERGKAREHRKKGEMDAMDAVEEASRTMHTRNVQNRKSELVLLCKSCNDKIGHIVYRGCE